MFGFISWLEATPLSAGMRDITWLWPACESLHFMGLCLLIGGAGFLDMRLMGFMRKVPMTAAKAFMPYAIAGFAVNLFTGTLFFIMAPGMYAFSLAWWAKMFFVALAGLNAMFFETTQGARVLTLGPDQDTPTAFKVIGGVSLLSWFMVLYFGRMLPYIGTGN
jgi:hypothetical protein